MQLLVVGPDLSIGDSLDTLAERPEGHLRETKESFGPRPENVHHYVTIVSLDENDLGNLRIGEVDAAQRGQALPATILMVSGHKGNSRFGGGNGSEDSVRVHETSEHVEFRMSPQGADQELSLHLTGIGDQDLNSSRTGGRHRIHKAFHSPRDCSVRL